ncbi:MAG: helix-turn-helix transcriptional regulator [Anaerolineales bacterium]|nr:helix-turn-helix transcriptional regulator [Anaerolineales bacterium]
MEEETQPIDRFVIQDLETLKVVADPLRAQVLELLAHEPLTVRQVADRLGLAASKLYYHFGMLEKHGLIRVVSTRLVANVQEKLYRTVAIDYDVDKSLLSFSTPEGKENITTLVRTTVDATREDILRSFQARAFRLEQGAAAQPRHVIISRALSRLSDEQAEAFGRRLQALLQEFGAADAAGPAHEAFALTIAFYPSFYFPEEGQPASPDG